MKKFICGLISAILIISLFTACAEKELKAPPPIGFVVAEQFTDYKLGTVPSLVSKKTITDNIDSPIVVKYNSIEKGLDALLNKKISGFVLPAFYANLAVEENDNFIKMQYPFIDRQIRGICKNDPSVFMLVETEITKLKTLKTGEKIARSYAKYPGDGETYVREENFETTGDKTLTVGICSDEAYPFNFKKDGKLTGINVDVAYEIAKGMKAELVIKEYTQDDLLPAFEAGEVDLILSQFTYTEGDKVPSGQHYTAPYYDDSTLILLRSALADILK